MGPAGSPQTLSTALMPPLTRNHQRIEPSQEMGFYGMLRQPLQREPLSGTRNIHGLDGGGEERQGGIPGKGRLGWNRSWRFELWSPAHPNHRRGSSFPLLSHFHAEHQAGQDKHFPEEFPPKC